MKILVRDVPNKQGYGTFADRGRRKFSYYFYYFGVIFIKGP
jgi:hypothetical protein